MIKLYHATYGVYKDSILEKGLLLPNGKSNFDMYIGEYIYLAVDPDVAESYCETAYDIPEEYLDDIIIFEVNIDKNELSLDPNNLCNFENNYDPKAITYISNKPILPNQLTLYRKEK